MSEGADRAGRFRSLLDRVYRDQPRSVMLEVADRCNETCVHCYQVQGQKGEMSTDEIRDILGSLAETGVMFLTISGGEATLRSDLLEIVDSARELGFVTTLYTNGLRMTAELAESLVERGVRRYEISLYSVYAEKHDWVTNVPGSWQKTVDGVKALVALGAAVKVKTPTMSFNADEEQAFIRFVVDELGAVPSRSADLKPREDGEADPTRFRVEEETEPAPDVPVAADWEAPLPPARTGKVCGACDYVHIEANGDIRPCTMLDVSLGDAREGRVLDQVENSPETQFLRSLRWQELPGCGQCELAGLCGRCHAESLSEVGKALEPYPKACSRALRSWEHHRQTRLGSEWKRENPRGPYREVGHALQRFAPEETETHRRWYEEHDWLVRRSPAGPVGAAGPGQLVQLRRPGKRAKQEKIPR